LAGDWAVQDLPEEKQEVMQLMMTQHIDIFLISVIGNISIYDERYY